MSKLTNNISATMSLRKPLKQSLELLDNLIEQAQLLTNPNIKEIQNISPLSGEIHLFEEFERGFPNICYSIATGIGKTRLMGAFVTYLARVRGIKNFLIISPNITIYDKLKEDFGNSGSKKYVFKGLPDMMNNVTVISGEDYETKGIQETDESIQINMFNIGKINADAKATTKNGKRLPPRIKRFRETLGDSYYNYMVNTKDLVIIMDEAHHYRAGRGMVTLNELNPILGIELTATPIGPDGQNRFKNIVFEYGLGDALRDNLYIKKPAVVTKANIDFKGMNANEIEKMKLKDAISIHLDTKEAIDTYVADYNEKPVKPIILVACRDTDHAKSVYEYITSNKFYNGDYEGRVLQIDSTTKDEEQIKQLLSVEDVNNPIEIIIHVYILKEGWDVANLYTIVPLQKADSIKLVEQTIGRGLRLPFGGSRTGVDKVDLLSIIVHDKFQEIVDAANNTDSVLYNIGKIELDENIIAKKKEIIVAKTNDIAKIEREEEEIEKISDEQIKTFAKRKHLPKKIATKLVREIILDKIVSTPNELLKEEIKEKGKDKINALIAEYKPDATSEEKLNIVKDVNAEYEKAVKEVVSNNIYIPNIHITVDENKNIIESFKLDVSKFDSKILHQEFELIRETLFEHNRDKIKITPRQLELPYTLIFEELKKKSEKNYNSDNSELLFDLCNQAVEAIESSLEEKNTLGETIYMYRELIAGIIYEQIKEHIKIEIISSSEPKANPYSLIVGWNFSKIKNEEIHNFKDNVSASILSSKVFNGFEKSCHDKYKFDSMQEKRFAEIIEYCNDVITWLRPARTQFNITYNNKTQKYVPDFVVETKGVIYLVEIKAKNEMDDKIVQQKADSAISYCKTATKLNRQRTPKEKDWEYLLIPHNKVESNATFNKLVNDYKM